MEFDAAVDSIQANVRSFETQLRRIADIQVEVDRLKEMLAKLTGES